jgi:tyrosyl-tRNA synthetase
MKLYQELTDRGFIHQTSAEIEEILDGPKRTIYHGIDPSADSAHAGNLVIWYLLRHLAKAGHTIVFLVGGATGRIGDPKPDAERTLLPEETIESNFASIQSQARKFIDTEDIIFVNNYDWFKEIKFIDFLRDVGKHFTVNELIKKDAIANRLSSDIGLSYTEFAYPLVQGYDYLELYRTYGCDVQVGGSDQWGNIVAGVDLVRRKEQASVYALTVPLVTDKATGKKFGKSEGNAVWIDPQKTTPYQFYQFWLNASDESVIDYLKLFTFLSLDEIAELEKDAQVNPGARAAQKQLAFSVTTLVHDEAAAVASKNVSDILFGSREVQDISADEIDILLRNAPCIAIKEPEELVAVLVATELATSKREARTFIESGAVSINNQKVLDVGATIGPEWFTNGIALLRRGKKSYSVLVIRD